MGVTQNSYIGQGRVAPLTFKSDTSLTWYITITYSAWNHHMLFETVYINQRNQEGVL